MAMGVVRAKTGSLDQTVSLTGTIVTADGRLLAYCAGYGIPRLAHCQQASDGYRRSRPIPVSDAMAADSQLGIRVNR